MELRAAEAAAAEAALNSYMRTRAPGLPALYWSRQAGAPGGIVGVAGAEHADPGAALAAWREALGLAEPLREGWHPGRLDVRGDTALGWVYLWGIVDREAYERHRREHFARR